jgi:hypothetical protein
MNYWFDAFTGRTWDEFRKAGASVSGFNKRFRRQVSKVQPGDVLLCYITGVMRWVGVLEATLAEYPAQAKLLSAIVDGPCFAADDLPEVPEAARKPPSRSKADTLFEQGEDADA